MSENQSPVPLTFLAGPPGVGKTSLGRTACETLGLRFLDLSHRNVVQQQAGLERLLTDRNADVVELPRELQLQDSVFKTCRKAGKLIALWAHPLDMHQRSAPNRSLRPAAALRVAASGCAAQAAASSAASTAPAKPR